MLDSTAVVPQAPGRPAHLVTHVEDIHHEFGPPPSLPRATAAGFFLRLAMREILALWYTSSGAGILEALGSLREKGWAL